MEQNENNHEDEVADESTMRDTDESTPRPAEKKLPTEFSEAENKGTNGENEEETDEDIENEKERPQIIHVVRKKENKVVNKREDENVDKDDDTSTEEKNMPISEFADEKTLEDELIQRFLKGTKIEEVYGQYPHNIVSRAYRKAQMQVQYLKVLKNVMKHKPFKICKLVQDVDGKIKNYFRSGPIQDLPSEDDVREYVRTHHWGNGRYYVIDRYGYGVGLEVEINDLDDETPSEQQQSVIQTQPQPPVQPQIPPPQPVITPPPPPQPVITPPPPPPPQPLSPEDQVVLNQITADIRKQELITKIAEKYAEMGRPDLAEKALNRLEMGAGAGGGAGGLADEITRIKDVITILREAQSIVGPPADTDIETKKIEAYKGIAESIAGKISDIVREYREAVTGNVGIGAIPTQIPQQPPQQPTIKYQVRNPSRNPSRVKTKGEEKGEEMKQKGSEQKIEMGMLQQLQSVLPFIEPRIQQYLEGVNTKNEILMKINAPEYVAQEHYNQMSNPIVAIVIGRYKRQIYEACKKGLDALLEENKALIDEYVAKYDKYAKAYMANREEFIQKIPANVDKKRVIKDIETYIQLKQRFDYFTQNAPVREWISKYMKALADLMEAGGM
jgi:hypothetical protein